MIETPVPAEYDPDLFRLLHAAQDRHFWFLHRNTVIANEIKRMRAGWTERSRVLEVGCGTGNSLRVLEEVCRPATVVGLELFEEALALARTRVSCQLIRGDLKDIPGNETLDLICAFDVIEHLDDDVAALGDFGRRLTPETGRVFVTVPAFMSLWSYFDEVACHRRRYTAATLRSAFQQAGFVVERMSYFMSPLFPLVWAGRRWAKLKGGTPEVMTENEFRIRPVVNSMLRAALSVENLVLAPGGRLPIGTSLLAIARPAARSDSPAS